MVDAVGRRRRQFVCFVGLAGHIMVSGVWRVGETGLCWQLAP